MKALGRRVVQTRPRMRVRKNRLAPTSSTPGARRKAYAAFLRGETETFDPWPDVERMQREQLGLARTGIFSLDETRREEVVDEFLRHMTG